MSDDLRMRVARTWLIERHGGDESAEQLAPELLAELDAVDPLRQARGDAVEALLCEWHNGPRWKDGMSTHYVNGQREVATRALNAALAVMGRSEAPAPPFPTWVPEMAAALDGLLLAAIEFHGFGEAGTELVRLHNAAFPDPARDGSP